MLNAFKEKLARLADDPNDPFRSAVIARVGPREAVRVEAPLRKMILALPDMLAARPLPRTRAEAFEIAPNVLIDNRASNRYTVIEANARDRPALLNALAYALFQSRVTIHSAHIATYGERAVDTFYVTDLTGEKITSDARLNDGTYYIVVDKESGVSNNFTMSLQCDNFSPFGKTSDNFNFLFSRISSVILSM